MCKLYGKELDAELEQRRAIKHIRINNRKTLKVAAKAYDMSVSEYLDWESGRDICPHENYNYDISGVHPPFLLMKICDKCRYPEIVSKIETDEDCEQNKEFIEKALKHRHRYDRKIL